MNFSESEIERRLRAEAKRMGGMAVKFVSPGLDGVSDSELRETQTANYFSDLYPIDCAVPSVNA